MAVMSPDAPVEEMRFSILIRIVMGGTARLRAVPFAEFERVAIR